MTAIPASIGPTLDGNFATFSPLKRIPSTKAATIVESF